MFFIAVPLLLGNRFRLRSGCNARLRMCGQFFHHFLIAQPSRNLLLTQPVKSCLIAIDSGHRDLLCFGWMVYCSPIDTVRNGTARGRDEARIQEHIKLRGRSDGYAAPKPTENASENSQQPENASRSLNREGARCAVSSRLST